MSYLFLIKCNPLMVKTSQVVMRREYTFIHLLEFCLIRQYILNHLINGKMKRSSRPPGLSVYFPNGKCFTWHNWHQRNIDNVTLDLVTWVRVLFHNSDFLFWFEKGNRKSLGDFHFSFSIWKWKSENRFNFPIFIYHLELKIRKLNLFSDFHFA